MREVVDLSVPTVERRTHQGVQKVSELRTLDLVAAYHAGGTVQGLAEQFGVHRTTVMAVLDRAGVARRSPTRVQSAEELDKASQLYRDGLNLRSVGAAVGADYRVPMRLSRTRAPLGGCPTRH